MLSYVIIKLLTTFVALISEYFNVLGEGNLDPARAYFYITIITNFSQIWCVLML